jgi:type VI secretion system protein ImpK
MNDPFAQPGEERTFIVPRPGARTPGAAATAPAAPAGGADVARDFPQVPVGLNPLLALANEVLALAPSLRHTAQHPDPAGLKEKLAYAIREFERRAAAAGIAPERVNAARYILCTVLDEAAASTPWGGSGVWARQSLLAAFHNETGGGEKVFQLMAKLAENVPVNRDLLELIYASLALGFEGRYRVADGGAAQLEAIRERLAQLLRKDAGDYPRALAQNWITAARRPSPLASWLPLWVTVASAAALLTLVFVGLSFSLAARSDAVASRLQGLQLAKAAPPAPAPAAVPAAPVAPRLAQFLPEDIRSGRLEVIDQVDSSVVTIHGDSLFGSGSAVPSSGSRELLARIGSALQQVPGTVVVSGYTDNQPIRSARFPSNFDLSTARAEAVRDLLIAQGLAAERVRAEGLADTDPIRPNDTPENRARNRRVEITLRAGGK